MAIQISGTTVIDDSRNIINGITITATSFSGKGMLEAGTVIVCGQSAAPTGFTKLITNNDKILRVVSGTGGGSGGVTAFSSVFPTAGTTPISITGTVGGTTLTTPQIPSHSHVTSNSPSFRSLAAGVGADYSGPSGSTGGSQSHDHPFSGSTSLDLRLQYVDVISCSRDA